MGTLPTGGLALYSPGFPTGDFMSLRFLMLAAGLALLFTLPEAAPVNPVVVLIICPVRFPFCAIVTFSVLTYPRFFGPPGELDSVG